VFQYDYARPALAADICVIHRYDVLLIERKDTGKLALPGGFLEEGETLLGCAFRELKEETSGLILLSCLINQIVTQEDG
jgi:bifunctional NMN adenylyltransferase/nudix hydrolase